MPSILFYNLLFSFLRLLSVIGTSQNFPKSGSLHWLPQPPVSNTLPRCLPSPNPQTSSSPAPPGASMALDWRLCCSNKAALVLVFVYASIFPTRLQEIHWFNHKQQIFNECLLCRLCSRPRNKNQPGQPSRNLHSLWSFIHSPFSTLIHSFSQQILIDHGAGLYACSSLIAQYLHKGVERTAHPFDEREKVQLVNLR